MSASIVTVHMAASLDGYIARRDGSVDWMETADRFDGGVVLTSDDVTQALAAIDCYVMGARTYETALRFETSGQGWVYGDKPTYVLTHRALRKTRDNVHFLAGDLRTIFAQQLKPRHANIWVVGGGSVCGACLRLSLVDELRVSLLPIVISAGIPFFQEIGKDIALHLKEVKAYANGVVALRHDVHK